MGLVKHIIALLAAVSALGALGCGKEPLLTNLDTNQLLVVLKGTYESNSPMPWAILPDAACQNSSLRPDGTLACDTYTADHLTYVQDDSVVVCSGRDAGNAFGKDDTHPGVFMIDIAEMVMMDYHGKRHKFSNYRQTYAFPLSDDDPIFNGAGFIMENDDVPSKAYVALGIYVRKMLLDSARGYMPDSSGWKSTQIWDVFSENELPSFNFNRYQMHSFYDSLRLESIYLNRVYPVIIPISDLKGFIYNNKFPLTVLEIRIVLKNFIKKYEVLAPGSGSTNVIHFYGFSDWLQDVQVDDPEVGGNLLTVARWYIPGLTGSITGTAGGNDAHVIAIPHDPSHSNISQYTIPYDPYTGTLMSGSLRKNNPANLPKAPSFAFGVSIQNMLDYNLKLEKFKYDWNQKVPSNCPSFDFYKNSWDTYSRAVCGLKIPELAVYVLAGQQYTIENVPPGSYDVYISNRAPRYGELYHEGEFTFVGTADVSAGSAATPVP
jgi:hypothetical protein